MAGRLSKLYGCKCKYLRATWLLLCISGNLFQIISLCTLYFEYLESARVVIDYPPKVFYPPASVICFNFLETVNWTLATSAKYLQHFPPEILALIKEANETSQRWAHVTRAIRRIRMWEKNKLTLDLLASIRLGDKLRDLIVDPSQMFPKIIFINNDNTTRTKKLLQTLTYNEWIHRLDLAMSIEAANVCFNFRINLTRFESRKYAMDFYEVNRDVLMNGLIYTIYLSPIISKDRFSSVKIGYLDHNESPRFGFTKKVNTHFTFGSCLSMTYREIEMNLLEPPYRSNCRNYSSERKSGKTRYDRARCINDCIRLTSMREFKAIIPGVSVALKDINNLAAPKMYSPYIGDNLDLVKMEQMNNLTDLCTLNCKKADCHTKYFIPELTVAVRKSFFNAIATFVFSFPPLKVTLKANITFLEFLTDIFSTFSFWLGLNLLNLRDFCKKLVDGFKTKQENLKKRLKKRKHQDKVVPFSADVISRQRYSSRVENMRLRHEDKEWKWYINPDDWKAKEI